MQCRHLSAHRNQTYSFKPNGRVIDAPVELGQNSGLYTGFARTPMPMPSAPSSTAPTPKRSFREQMHLAREDAIISAVNRLLAEKGFDAMTVDEVAAEVGIAKASLYKHITDCP